MSATLLQHRRRPHAVSLVSAAASGDEAAWNDIVASFGPKLHRVACRSGLSGHEAQDAVQETWLARLRNLTALRAPDADGVGLATTGARESFRQHRRFGRETREESCTPS